MSIFTTQGFFVRATVLLSWPFYDSCKSFDLAIPWVPSVLDKIAVLAVLKLIWFLDYSDNWLKDGFACQLCHDLCTRALVCSAGTVVPWKAKALGLSCAAFPRLTYTRSWLLSMLSFSMKVKSLRRLCCAAFLWLTYTSSRLFTVTAVPWKEKAPDGFAAQLFYDLRTRALDCSLSQLFHQRKKPQTALLRSFSMTYEYVHKILTVQLAQLFHERQKS